MVQQNIRKQSTYSNNLKLKISKCLLTSIWLIIFICLLTVIAISLQFQKQIQLNQTEILKINHQLALTNNSNPNDNLKTQPRNLETKPQIKTAEKQRKTQTFKKPYNIQEYDKLVELNKQREIQEKVFFHLNPKPQIIFPSQKFNHIPIQKLLINGLEVPMHHEILPAVLPIPNSSYFRRSISHRYAFPTSPPASSQTLTLQSPANTLSFIQKNILSTPDHTQLCKKFYFNSHIDSYKKAELFYTQLKYKTDKFLDELPICVIGTGKNLFSRGLYMDFFRTVSKQNYTNYHVVVIDDGSSDGSLEVFIQTISKYFPQLMGRIVLIKNELSLGAFNNKDFGIKQNCNINDIIIEIDMDDSLIGRQVFKILNAQYQSNTNLHIIYSDFLIYNHQKQTYWRGLNSYLTYQQWINIRPKLKNWKTGHLKSYKKSLYTLIPLNYLADLQNIDQNGIKYPIYGRYTSDQYMMISMIQLAGYEGVKFVDQILYLYRKGQGIQENAHCHIAMQFYQQLKGRIKTPLKRQENGKVSIRENYQVNNDLIKIYQNQQNIIKKQCLFYLQHPFQNYDGQIQQNFVFSTHNLNYSTITSHQRLISVAFISPGRAELLSRTIESFFSTNTFPITKMIVIWDNHSSSQLLQLKQKYKKVPQLTWLITEVVIGELAAIDLAFKEIDSEYLFICEDNVLFEQGKFLQQAINILQKNTDVGQVLLKEKNSGWFELSSGVQRVASYKIIGSYTEYTKNVTYGKSAQITEPLLSLFYFSKDIKTFNLSKNFLNKICPQCTKWPIFLIGQKTQKQRKQFLTFYSNAIKTKEQILLKSIREMDLKDDQVDSQGKWLSNEIIDSYYTNFMYRQKFQTNFINKFDLFQIPFEKQQKKQRKIQKIPIKHFSAYPQVQIYLQNFTKPQQTSKSLQILLSHSLLQQKQNQKNNEAEYHFYNKKYEIGSEINQNPICIIITNFQSKTQTNFLSLIQSIHSQNYSNYHVEIISHLFWNTNHQLINKQIQTDSHTIISSQDIFKNILNLVSKQQFDKVKQKLRLWKSLVSENVGKVRVGVERVCGIEDIVLVVDGGKFIGQEAFKVINAQYKDKGVWFMGSIKYGHGQSDKKQIKLLQNNRIQNHSLFDQTFWSFRSQLMKYVSPYHLTFHHLNFTNGLYSPQFYNISSLNSIYLSMLQLCGNSRVRLIDDFVYFQNQLKSSQGQCSSQQNEWVFRQIQSKRIMRSLKSLIKDTVNFNEKYKVPQQIKKQAKISFSKFSQCKKKFKQTNFETKKNQNESFEKENIKQKQQNQEIFEPKKNKLGKLIETKINNIQFPQHYIDIYKVKSFDSLPFCLVASISNNNKDSISQIENSIKSQNYPHTTLLFTDSFIDYPLIFKECPQQCLVIFLNSELKNGSLSYLNQIHQVYNIWMSYSVDIESVKIHSVYLWVLKLLSKQKKVQNTPINNVGIDLLRIIDFSKENAYRVSKEKITDNDAHFKVLFSDQSLVNNEPIQQFPLNKVDLFSFTSKTPKYVALKQAQYQQLPNLPHQHSLYQRKKLEQESVKNKQIRKY